MDTIRRPLTDRTEASVQKADLPWGGGGKQLVFGVRNHLISIRTVPELGTLLSLAGERPPTYELRGTHPSQMEKKRMQMLESFLQRLTQAFWETPEGTLCWVGLDWIAAVVPPHWGFCKSPTSSGDRSVFLLSEIIYFPQFRFFPHQSKPVFFSLAMNTN